MAVCGRPKETTPPTALGEVFEADKAGSAIPGYSRILGRTKSTSDWMKSYIASPFISTLTATGIPALNLNAAAPVLETITSTPFPVLPPPFGDCPEIARRAMIADNKDCLFPIASLTIVCSTIDSNLGIVDADKGLAEGRAGLLPRKGGVGLFNS
jgi:hypothetical protein